ncbi:hypothetical protein D3C87_1916860 [compost metagenome]
MVVMTVHHIRAVLPLRHPIQHCNLISQETFGIITISINLGPVEQTGNMDQEQIKSQFICFFPEYPYCKILKAQFTPAIIYHLKLILL